MFKMFIRRPILSAVISVIFVCLGALAIVSLPITQFPDIVPPSVTVTARYTGASADVMSKTVATPLERAINGVSGMTYMTTVCTNDGMSLTTIYFKVGTDPDVAAVNVQNRVTTVLDELPEEVIRAGVVTEKEVNSMLMYLNVFSTDSTHTEKFVYNFTDINILRELKRIDGVGLVELAHGVPSRLTRCCLRSVRERCPLATPHISGPLSHYWQTFASVCLGL